MCQVKNIHKIYIENRWAEHHGGRERWEPLLRDWLKQFPEPPAAGLVSKMLRQNDALLPMIHFKARYEQLALYQALHLAQRLSRSTEALLVALMLLPVFLLTLKDVVEHNMLHNAWTHARYWVDQLQKFW